MTGTTAKRVSVEAIAANTKRVTTTGVTIGSSGNDTWGGTWGGTWGATWYTSALPVAASPTEGSTKRVTAAVAEDSTKRVIETPMTTVS